MKRDEAYKLLTKYLKNKNLLKHSFAAEASMKALYRKMYGETSSYAKATEDKWGIAGLLHDVDYELAQDTNQLEKHGLLIFDPDLIGVDKELDLIPEDIAHAIKAHNFHQTNVLPQNEMDWSIVTCDRLTGFIVAVTLVHPDRKLASITPEFVLKKLKISSFAKNVNRESISLCETELNLPLSEFVEIVLEAMQGISDSLGL